MSVYDNIWNWSNVPFFVLSRYPQIILFRFQTIYLFCIYLFYPEFGVTIKILIIFILQKLENCFMIFFCSHLQFPWCWFFPLFMLFHTYITRFYKNCLYTRFVYSNSRTDIIWFYLENITMSRILDDHILKTHLNNFTLVQFVLHFKSYVLTRHIHRLMLHHLHLWYI